MEPAQPPANSLFVDPEIQKTIGRTAINRERRATVRTSNYLDSYVIGKVQKGAALDKHILPDGIVSEDFCGSFSRRHEF